MFLKNLTFSPDLFQIIDLLVHIDLNRLIDLLFYNKSILNRFTDLFETK